MKRARDIKLDAPFCQALRRFYSPLTAYHADVAADFYEGRGQVDQALNEWRRAEELNSEAVDSKACQAALKAVSIGDRERLELQLQWANRHAISLHDQDSVRFRALDAGRRITVGYMCSFWDSPTIRGQAIPFISNHDRSRFRVVGYALEKCDASITQHFEEFRIVKKLSHVELAGMIRQDGCDALVELTGFSPHHRHAVMGARCAPVQITYLNHAGTSGVANVDYVVADDISAPGELNSYFSEKILRLPGTFFNFNYEWDDFPDSGPPPSLATDHVTLGCFGSQSKINDAQIYMWARLLLALPSTRLFLRNQGLATPENRDFMIRRFRQWGIDASRLRLEPGGDRASILKNYREVDVSLDTWPYNGGNTIAESLWQGVPVLTILGSSFASRYGASLLTASGCRDMVAKNLDDLIRIARELIEDKPRLAKLRTQLRHMMHQFGFADSERFCRNWEQALETTVKSAFALAPPRAA